MTTSPRFGIAITMLLTSLLPSPMPARASVDLTGMWAVMVQTPFPMPVDAEWTLVQSGTQLTLTYTLLGGDPEGPYVGTIDPGTGEFSIPLPDSDCTGSTPNGITGSASPDGHTVSGTWTYYQVLTLPALGCFSCCFSLLDSYTGMLLGCGNGVVDDGETCDDGNETGGDCCSMDCQVAAVDGTSCTDGDVCTTGDACAAGSCTGTGELECNPGEVCGPSGCEFVCGNGVLDAGEACDDGNLDAGDCCSSLCETATPDGTSCTDDDVCTSDDQCTAGSCVPGAPLVCDPCEVCGTNGCELPALSCQPALAGGKAKLTFKAPAGSPSKNKLTWSWRSSAAVALEDFGDPGSTPSGTDLTLCMLDQAGGVPTLRASATAPGGGFCGARPCWTWRSKGYSYKDSSATPDGIVGMQLGTGSAAGQGKLSVKAKGENLELPGEMLTPPVVVRVIRNDAPTCWEATYSAPTVNDGVSFKAKSD